MVSSEQSSTARVLGWYNGKSIYTYASHYFSYVAGACETGEHTANGIFAYYFSFHRRPHLPHANCVFHHCLDSIGSFVCFWPEKVQRKVNKMGTEQTKMVKKDRRLRETTTKTNSSDWMCHARNQNE